MALFLSPFTRFKQLKYNIPISQSSIIIVDCLPELSSNLYENLYGTFGTTLNSSAISSGVWKRFNCLDKPLRPLISWERGGTEMYFPSKKDLWLGIVIWCSLLSGIYLAATEADRYFILLISLILNLALFGWIWFKTGYTLTDNSLEIKCGPFYQKIPYSKIRSVKRTRDPSGGYALSLDRIKIKHGYDITIISPIDPHIFITELKRRCSDAEFPGL